jgi:Tol biopolymer transport system component
MRNRTTTLLAALSGFGLLLAGCSSADEPPFDVAGYPIVFSSNRDGSYDLWLMKENGKDPLQLTSDPGDEGFPSWSPDGDRLAFILSNEMDPDADGIYVMNADGTGRQQLTHADELCESSPSWSPNGLQILYAAGDCTEDNESIYIMNSDGRNARKIVDGPAGWPDWSPDGRRIVYIAEDAMGMPAVWVSDADGTNRTPLSPDGITAATESTWSSDGTIAFVTSSGDPTSDDPAAWNEDVFVMNDDGTNLRQITSSTTNDHWPPAWSPDGSRLIYTERGDTTGDGELIVVDVDTLEGTQLTDNDAEDMWVDWRDMT